MVTYTYTGKLTDFGESPFPNATPKLWVEAIQSAFSSTGPSAKRRIPITVAPNGDFSVTLVASADLTPETKYLMRCEWLQDNVIAGWTDWVFPAAIGGGPIANMAGLEITNIWYSTNPPPINRSGIYWIHPTTGDVREWV